jgi:hypothetical protein
MKLSASRLSFITPMQALVAEKLPAGDLVYESKGVPDGHRS